jgi:hypothetical protein
MTSSSTEQPTPQPASPGAFPGAQGPEAESEAEKARAQAESAVHQAEAAVEEMAREGKMALVRLGRAMKKPATGAAIAGTVTIAAAILWGAAEAAVGAGAAYVVYRLLRRRAMGHEHEHAEHEQHEKAA